MVTRMVSGEPEAQNADFVFGRTCAIWATRPSSIGDVKINMMSRFLLLRKWQPTSAIKDAEQLLHMGCVSSNYMVWKQYKWLSFRMTCCDGCESNFLLSQLMIFAQSAPWDNGLHRRKRLCWQDYQHIVISINWYLSEIGKYVFP